MKIKDICKEYNISYDSKHPKNSLRLAQNELLIKEIGKNDYDVIRHLTLEEKRARDIRIKIKPDLEKLVCTTLAFSDECALCGSIRNYYEVFSMVNNKFKIFAQPSSCSKYDNGALYHIFYREIDHEYRRIVKEVFSDLEKSFIIYVNKKLVFVEKINGVYRKRYANKEDTEKMLSAGRQVMDKYGYKKYDEIKYYDKSKIKDEVSDLLGIDFFYNDYEIILNRDYLEKYKIEDEGLSKKVNELSSKKALYCTQGALKDYSVDDVLECVEELIKHH